MSESKTAGNSGGKEGQKEHDQDKVCAGFTSDGQVCGTPVAEGAMGSITARPMDPGLENVGVLGLQRPAPHRLSLRPVRAAAPEADSRTSARA